MKTGILLAGHGSHISANTAGLVWECVDHLRRLNLVHEVSAGFWKEQPSFHEALDAFTADDITVIPVFTTRGFFTQEVIPAEMGLTGALTQRDGKTIRYTRTLSETPFLGEMLLRRITETVAEYNLAPEQCAVAVIGHSTRRNPESRKAVEAQAARLRELGTFKQVHAVYLDDSPEISEIYTLTDAPTLIAVPFFMAEGSHVIYDVPHELGIVAGTMPQIVQGRTVYYTAPTGTDNGLVDALLALGREAGLPFLDGVESNGFPTYGRELLWEQVNAQPFAFGQLWLEANQVRFPKSARIRTDWEVSSLRNAVRNTPNGFRFHAAALDLPEDLPALAVTNAEELHAIVETIYPGAVAHWARAQAGTFSANTFVRTVSRQVGQFRALAALSEAKQSDLITTICMNCARHPTWHDGMIPKNEHIPCGEPCNVWLSTALQANS
jgi:sirohydrochlorin cobaltochelatase